MPRQPRIVTAIERAPADEVRALGTLGVATVHEANGRTGLMYGIRPVTPGLSTAGSAITCLNAAGDNLMVHAALDLAKPGDVLIVAVTAPSAHGMFGDLLATSCQARGVTGVVLDAGARDSGTLRAMGFATWARHISAAGTVKATPGWVNIPVCCGGQVVFPGDVVVADDDGVVVVERRDVSSVLEAATQRQKQEASSREKLRAGHSTLDNGGRREMLAPYMSQEAPVGVTGPVG